MEKEFDQKQLSNSFAAETILNEMVEKSKYVVNILKVAQISEDAIVHELVMALNEREMFNDATDLNEKVYTGDVFEAILTDYDTGVEPLSEKALRQCEELAKELGYYEYVMITKV